MRAEAGVLEARLQKQRAEDALSDYLASRPKRARVEEIEDAAPEPKRVRASIQSDAPRASPSPPEV